MIRKKELLEQLYTLQELLDLACFKADEYKPEYTFKLIDDLLNNLIKTIEIEDIKND